MSDRYLIIILGNSTNIAEELNHIADAEHGVNYVDGNGIFLGTFYSPYTTHEIHDFIITLPSFLLFNITDNESNAINLPSKYFKGLFPEYDEALDIMREQLIQDFKEQKEKIVIEEYDNVDDILDKLSRNEYDRNCLTEKELEILDKHS